MAIKRARITPARASRDLPKGGPEGWIQKVRLRPAATFAPPGTFDKDAESIARTMAAKRVSPKGVASAIRMVQFFLNRSGSGISKTRRRELEKAKRLLQERLRQAKR